MATLTNEWVDISMASESATGNGSTTDFVTSYPLKSINSVWVYVNGLLYTITTHYTVTVATKTISFVTAPAAGSKITIKYILGA